MIFPRRRQNPRHLLRELESLPEHSVKQGRLSGFVLDEFLGGAHCNCGNGLCLRGRQLGQDDILDGIGEQRAAGAVTLQ